MKMIPGVLCRFVVVALFGMTLACGNDVAIEKTTDPARLGTLAAAVEKATPQEGDRMLAREGYDEPGFRMAVEDVMGDPDRVVIFSEAYKTAKR